MSSRNGWPPSVLPTRRRGRLSRLASVVRMKLQSSPLFASLVYVLMLFGLAMLLSACATPSAPPTEYARNPQAPQLSEPLPSESYLQKAQKLIESWRNAVTGM